MVVGMKLAEVNNRIEIECPSTPATIIGLYAARKTQNKKPKLMVLGFLSSLELCLFT